jgi:hypothetical protein
MPKPDPNTLQMILEHYQRSAKERGADERWWTAEGLSFERACERAAKAISADGRIHSHHRRPGSAVMREFSKVVVGAASRLERAADFDELLDQVEDLAKGVRGAGELVAYDVADRIGLYCGIAPQRVYLHAGTRHGAHRLGLGTARNTRSISLDDLPCPLDALAPRDAENILCTYQAELLMTPEDCLHALANKKGRSCKTGRVRAVC